jgi:hypothetical protein
VTDQLAEMFDQARAAALPSVQPPGVAAARRTVRRRRTSIVAGAAVAVAAVVGSMVLAPQTTPVTPALPGPPRTGDTAYAALLGGGPETVAIGSQGPVFADFSRREQVYVPSLTLAVACFGSGRFTMVVNGRPDDQGRPTELSRAPVVCSTAPVVVKRQFRLPSPITSEIDVRLVEVAARGEFAYRLTAPRSAYPTDPLNSPVEAVRWPGGTMLFAEAGEVSPGRPWGKADAAVLAPGVRYTVAAACAGAGTLVLQTRQPGGEVLELRTPCSWPPGRYAVTTPPTAGGSSLWVRYESDDPAPAQYAWAVS